MTRSTARTTHAMPPARRSSSLWLNMTNPRVQGPETRTHSSHTKSTRSGESYLKQMVLRPSAFYLKAKRLHILKSVRHDTSETNAKAGGIIIRIPKIDSSG